jgi:hypothetical protein
VGLLRGSFLLLFFLKRIEKCKAHGFCPHRFDSCRYRLLFLPSKKVPAGSRSSVRAELCLKIDLSEGLIRSKESHGRRWHWATLCFGIIFAMTVPPAVVYGRYEVSNRRCFLKSNCLMIYRAHSIVAIVMFDALRPAKRLRMPLDMLDEAAL